MADSVRNSSWWQRNTRHVVLSALLLITIVLLLWHQWGMNRMVVLSAANTRVSLVTDMSADGHGTSRGEIRIDARGWQVKCMLDQGHASPYCGLDITLGKPEHGVDWSSFDSLWVRYRYELPQHEDEQAHLRLSLFNFEPSYSTSKDYLTSKVEEVILLAQPGWQEREFKLNAFNVPAWWTLRRESDPTLTAVNFNRIVLLRLSTGYGAAMGVQHFELARIELRGKWVSAERLRLGLILLWMCAGMGWLLAEWRQSQARLHESRRRQRWLESANQTLSEQSQAMASQAMIDPLTQIRNRAGLREFLATHWEYPDSPLSIIFFDLDYFKKINDEYGHNVGDEVLQHFAAWVIEHIRPGDCFVRWGGEEFLLLSTGTPLAGAAKLAEKIRASMASTQWPHGQNVTCSCGVAEMQPAESFESVMLRADDALYRAKAAGRNRVELALPASSEKT